MLVDDVMLTVKAGDGGDGRVDFNRTKMSLGPTGGRGGKGGDVLVCGVSDIGALSRFKSVAILSAGDGMKGGVQKREGKGGADLILSVPTGTVIHFPDSGKREEVRKLNEKKILLRGGRGGRGNFFFRSPVNTSPKHAEAGEEGSQMTIRLELKLIADVGLIGLPNAGKSSLLNALTNAKSHVGNYPFTTLEPNLGTYYALILADIPGLIEGASEGKGLGVKFLRHIERTGALFHLVSVENENPVFAYQTVCREMEKHNPKLANKKEYVFLSKCDMVSKEECEKKKHLFEAIGVQAMELSRETREGLVNVKRILSKIQEEKTYRDAV